MYSGHINRGVETWTSEIAGRLGKDHEVFVLQGEDQTENKNYKIQPIKLRIFWRIKANGNRWSRYRESAYWISLNLSFSIRAILQLITIDPDIVIPTNGGVQTLILRVFSKLFGWKMVLVGHAGIGRPEKWNLLMRPDLYIMPSERGKKWAQGLWFSKGIKIINIPHGIDLVKFNPNVQPVKITLKKPIVLCVSAFDAYKRVDLTIRAVSRLRNVSLLILGGDNESKINDLGEKLLGDRYKQVRVDPDKIPGYYAACDVFTLPSNRYEAFGIVYLEALASNLPVVATDDELRKEIIGNAGLLVEPTNTKEYSEAINSALQKDWGDLPRKQAEKFDWDNIVEKYEEELERAINNNQ